MLQYFACEKHLPNLEYNLEGGAKIAKCSGKYPEDRSLSP